MLLGQGAFIHVKAIVAQVLLERAFAMSQATGAPVKPWSWADTWPIARMSVPRIGASAIVLWGDSGQSLAFGPGHVTDTPLPGAAGTSVISAHRDTHFTFLREIRKGDRIDIAMRDGSKASFVVTGMRVARFDRSGIDPERPGHWLALTTCWPFRANHTGPLRYIVDARLERPPG